MKFTFTITRLDGVKNTYENISSFATLGGLLVLAGDRVFYLKLRGLKTWTVEVRHK